MNRRLGWLLALATVVAAYLLGLRPKLLTWGASENEAERALPGDDLIPYPCGQSTRAITISAPVSVVWPWLVQLGYGRGGFYSYDALESMMGVPVSSARELLPEFQTLAVGDKIALGADGPELMVVRLEPQHALVLRAVDRTTGGAPNPESESYWDFSWVFALGPLNDRATRLIIRARTDYRPWLIFGPFNLVLDVIQFFMERKMMQGIKQRAEGAAYE